MNKTKLKLADQNIFASVFSIAAILLVFVINACAQQSSEEEKLIEPSRPTVANSAEFQKPGVLQSQ